MEHVFLDIPRLYTALAEWGACGVYILILNRRFKSNGLTAAVGAAALAIQMFFLQVTGDVALALWIPCMIGAAALMFAYLMIICRINFKTAVYCCAQAFLLAEFAASLEWQLHNYLLILSADWLWLQLLLLAAVYTGVFIAAYFIERPAFSKEYLSQLSVRELISAVGIVVVAFAFSNISFVMTNSPFFGQMKMDMFLIRTIVDFSGITVLYAFQSRICEYIVEKEKTMIQAMLKSQYEQYRSYQESMELMHIKYHDLKHQIAGLRAENDSDKRKAWIDAMEQELEASALLLKTGNHVLDNILNAKMLYAKKHQIRLTCVADGSLLNFMHVTDICTIFGNALDNAIESVLMQEDTQKRLIHIAVSSVRQFIFIQISNYCDYTVEHSEGQLPQTTKTDKKNHGFGLKSIRYSAQKYGGTLTVSTDKNWFELKLLIPVKNAVSSDTV